MPDINKPLLRSKIIRSRELTALEKRYLEEIMAAHDWIPCSERMPENLARVLFAFHGSNVRSGFRNCGLGSRNAWYSEGFHYDDNEITHWMPIPEPPKGDPT